MSITEILAELPKLSSSDQGLISERIDELLVTEFEESPEMLEAIDVGRQSIKEGKMTTVDEARELVARWTIRSS